jgi:hypothetical protein
VTAERGEHRVQTEKAKKIKGQLDVPAAIKLLLETRLDEESETALAGAASQPE